MTGPETRTHSFPAEKLDVAVASERVDVYVVVVLAGVVELWISDQPTPACQIPTGEWITMSTPGIPATARA